MLRYNEGITKAWEDLSVFKYTTLDSNNIIYLKAFVKKKMNECCIYHNIQRRQPKIIFFKVSFNNVRLILTLMNIFIDVLVTKL